MSAWQICAIAVLYILALWVGVSSRGPICLTLPSPSHCAQPELGAEAMLPRSGDHP